MSSLLPVHPVPSFNPFPALWSPAPNIEDAQNLISAAREARLKAVANGAMAVGVGLAVTAVAYAVYLVATVIIKALILPLAIIPPLWLLIGNAGGLTVAGLVGVVAAKKYGKEFFENAKEHWNHANELYAKAEQIAPA